MNNNFYLFLSNRIFSNDLFKEDLETLFYNQFSRSNSMTDKMVKRLLETAAIFSLSPNELHHTLSFKIAIFLWSQFNSKYQGMSFLMQLILARLGDLPTMEFLIKNEDLKDYFFFFEEEKEKSYIRYLHYPEVLDKKIINQYDFSNQKWNFTNFQAMVYSSLLKGNNVTFSAPTSAGKSLTIQRYIANRIIDSNSYSAIYLAPSRSLISEIHEKMIGLIKSLEKNEDKELVIATSINQFNKEYVLNSKKWILIITPERLLQLSTEISLKPDLLIVDEAQKISDNERGTIIEDAITQVITESPHTQKIFISPSMANMDHIETIFQIPNLNLFKTRKTPVGQNIFFIEFTGRMPIQAIFELYIQEYKRRLFIERKDVMEKLDNADKKKAWTALNLPVDKSSTIIYCNYPSQCRKVSQYIIDFKSNSQNDGTVGHTDKHFVSAYDLQKTNEIISEDLKETIKFLSDYLHSEYYLIDYLKNKVGYHYGRMPHFVRNAIKNLFDNKEIEVLCCTSTLLEGVNMPAKNVILFNPKIGLRDTMDKGSILNLAGRAGRLTKEYYGNVFCIEIENWQDKTMEPFDGNEDILKSSVEDTFSEDIDLLIHHLNKFTSQKKEKKNIEIVATSLFHKVIKYDDLSFLQSYKERVKDISDDKYREVYMKLSKFREDSLPIRDVIQKNPSIDPRLQIDLYNHLKANSPILPIIPEDTKRFFDNLSDIFKILSEYLLKEHSGRSYVYYAFVATKWILHFPYKSILENKIRYESSKDEVTIDKKFINDMIEDLEEVIENQLKYHYTRALRCYCDILARINKENGIVKPFCSELPDYLENGASDMRILFLIGIGISRTTAIKIYETINDDIKDIFKFKAWLNENFNTICSELPPILSDELKSFLGR